MRRETYYAYDCMVNCTDTGNDVNAEVVLFQPGSRLSVSVQGMKIMLTYNKQHDIYIGNSAGLEFQSNGPKALN